MEIEMSYSSKDDIPSGYEELYTQEEETSPWVLTGVKNMVFQKDVDDVKEALRKESKDHKDTKGKLKEWEGLDAKETREKLDKIPELEAIAEGAKGKIDEKKMEEILTARMAQKIGPLERQVETLTGERNEANVKIIDLEKQILNRDRDGIVRDAAVDMKVIDTAVPDVLLNARVVLERNEEGRFVTKDGIDGVTPGLDAKAYLKEMQKARPHWWPVSEGGGAGGGRGGPRTRANNPFTRELWNLTEQGRIIKDEGLEEAQRLAKAAGTKVGGARPAPKAA